MHLLNRFFTPFALILILSAIYYSEPEPRDSKLSLGILALSILVNWYLSANTYRFIRWSKQLKVLQIWLNFLWSAPLVYLLIPYWAPMWLLFTMAPVTAALYTSFSATLGMGVVSAGTLLGVYYLRNPLEGPALGMACVHAAFIIVFGLFVQALAQTALRLRDANAA
jgi:hypothetical protein